MRVARIWTGEPGCVPSHDVGPEDELFAPPLLAKKLGRSAQWPPADALARLAAPCEELADAAAAAQAVLEAHARSAFDWIEYPAERGAGWMIGLHARQGRLPGARLRAILPPSVEPLLHQFQLGDTAARAMVRAATRGSLRDADVLAGAPEALAALELAGWSFAVPREAAKKPASISAVVTHKNLARYLPDCLRSLRAQTVPLEIVLVDDGSEPDQLRVAEQECARDPAIRLLHGGARGVSHARNLGAAEASGELILVVDADNLMRPALAERLRRALEAQPGADVAVPAFRRFRDTDGADLGLYCPIELSPECRAPLFLENICGDACALHRREALLASGGYIEEGSILEDWHLWLTFLEQGRTGTVVPEVLFDYRVREASLVRVRGPLQQHFDRFSPALLHPRLLGQVGHETAFFAAARLNSIVAGVDGALAQARASRAALEQEQATLNTERAALAASRNERAALQSRHDQLRAAHQLQTLRAEQLAAERATLALGHAKANEAHSSEKAQLQEQVSHRSAERDEARQSVARGEARITELLAALHDVHSSSAVTAARMLRALSPSAHQQLGPLLRKLLAAISSR
jgi:hypothetical protein